MKRYLIIIVACLLTVSLHAQRISKSFNNVSLSEALLQLNRQTSEYTIYFLYNDLEDFRVTTTINRKPLPDAILQMIGFYPVSMTVDTSDPSERKIFVECSQKTNRRYRGRVVDDKGRPIEFANVALLSPKDSSMINGGVTNVDGYFVIPCDAQKVIARVSYVGYKTFQQPYSSPSIGTIRLITDHISLKGVTVKAQRPQYKMAKGGMTIDVENSVLSKMGNAYDVLGQLPRVSVNGNRVNVFAKGTPLIYINNKKIANGSELSELKSEEIKSVDVITSPGAQYDATVQSVIRIRTKKAQEDKFSFRNDANALYSGMWQGYEQTLLKYRSHGLEVSNRLYWARNAEDEHIHKLDYSMNYNGHQTCIHQDSHVNGTSSAISERLNISYDINDSNSIGASYRYYAALTGNADFDGHQTITRDNGVLGDIQQLQKQGRKVVPLNEANVYYVGRLSKWQVDFNGSYIFTKLNEHGDATESSNSLGNRTVTSKGLQSSHLWAGKLVLSYDIARSTLSLGSEYTYTAVNGFYHNAEGYVNNSETRQTENNIAAFAEYGLSFGNWRIDAGLRYEHVSSKYYSFGRRENEPSHCYNHLFPNLTLSWNEHPWALQLNYSIKTSRPSYRDLRNYLQYDSRYLLEGGNPYLRPSYKHSIELSIIRGWMNASVGYTYTKDAMVWMFCTMDDREAIVIQSRNLSHSQSAYASFSVSPKFGWYQPLVEVGYKQQWQNSLKLPVNIDKPAFNFRFNNRLIFSKNFMMYINLMAYTHFYEINRSQNGYTTLSFGMRKSFLNDKLT